MNSAAKMPIRMPQIECAMAQAFVIFMCVIVKFCLMVREGVLGDIPDRLWDP
jgi:hypothetical protein